MKKGLLSSIIRKSPEIPRPVADRLVAVVESDLATDLLDQYEQRMLAKRAQLAKQLVDLPKQHEKTIVDAGKRAQAALLAHEKALDAARKAMEESNQAAAAAYGAQLQLRHEVGTIERELLASADPRIQEFILQLGLLHDAAGAGLQYWIETTGRGYGRSNAIPRSNVEEVKAARDLLEELKSNCFSMRLQALSRIQVEQSLLGMIERLPPVLAPLELKPPRIEDGEVRPPLGLPIIYENSAPGIPMLH